MGNFNNDKQYTNTSNGVFSDSNVHPEERPKDDAIFCMCELSGYHLEERIVVKDLRTGKIWR